MSKNAENMGRKWMDGLAFLAGPGLVALMALTAGLFIAAQFFRFIKFDGAGLSALDFDHHTNLPLFGLILLVSGIFGILLGVLLFVSLLSSRETDTKPKTRLKKFFDLFVWALAITAGSALYGLICAVGAIIVICLYGGVALEIGIILNWIFSRQHLVLDDIHIFNYALEGAVAAFIYYVTSQGVQGSFSRVRSYGPSVSLFGSCLFLFVIPLIYILSVMSSSGSIAAGLSLSEGRIAFLAFLGLLVVCMLWPKLGMVFPAISDFNAKTTLWSVLAAAGYCLRSIVSILDSLFVDGLSSLVTRYSGWRRYVALATLCIPCAIVYALHSDISGLLPRTWVARLHHHNFSLDFAHQGLFISTPSAWVSWLSRWLHLNLDMLRYRLELPKPVILALLLPVTGIVVGLIRRVSWVDADRERSLLIPEDEARPDTKIRIGFETDSRNLMLLGVALLCGGIIPVALYAGNLDFHLFTTEPGTASPNFLAWLGYVGSELTKVIPLFDWSKVYGFGDDGPLKPAGLMGRHVAFVVRASLDILILSILIQAFSQNAKQQKLRDEFDDEDDPLSRLDPFEERARFRRLATSWDACKAFPPYDENRLETLFAETTTADNDKETGVARLVGWQMVTGALHTLLFARGTSSGDSGVSVGDIRGDIERFGVSRYPQSLRYLEADNPAPASSPVDSREHKVREVVQGLNYRFDALGDRRPVTPHVIKALAPFDAAYIDSHAEDIKYELEQIQRHKEIDAFLRRVRRLGGYERESAIDALRISFEAEDAKIYLKLVDDVSQDNVYVACNILSYMNYSSDAEKAITDRLGQVILGARTLRDVPSRYLNSIWRNYEDASVFASSLFDCLGRIGQTYAMAALKTWIAQLPNLHRTVIAPVVAIGRRDAGLRPHAVDLLLEQLGAAMPLERRLAAARGLYFLPDARAKTDLFQTAWQGYKGIDVRYKQEAKKEDKNQIFVQLAALTALRQIDYEDLVPDLQLLLDRMENERYRLPTSLADNRGRSWHLLFQWVAERRKDVGVRAAERKFKDTLRDMTSPERRSLPTE